MSEESPLMMVLARETEYTGATIDIPSGGAVHKLTTLRANYNYSLQS